MIKNEVDQWRKIFENVVDIRFVMKGIDDIFGKRWIITIVSWCRWSENNYEHKQARHGGQ